MTDPTLPLRRELAAERSRSAMLDREVSRLTMERDALRTQRDEAVTERDALIDTLAAKCRDNTYLEARVAELEVRGV